MPESTLSVTYRQIQQEVGYWIGWRSDHTKWSTEKLAMINSCVDEGLRQFYTPPLLPGQTRAHRWSFLRPINTLTVVVPYSTGSIALTQGSKSVVLSGTGAAWPSWAAGSTLVVDGESLAVETRTDDTHVQLAIAWPADNAVGKAFTLERRAYDLPDVFASVEGSMTFEYGSGVTHFVAETGEGVIRGMLAASADQRPPTHFAIRPKRHDGTQSTGQRFEVLFYPVPDAAYTLYYPCRINPEAMDRTHPESTYPPGGAQHASTMIASCLAAAEFKIKSEEGPLHTRFLNRLGASIEADLALAPRYLGQNTNRLAVALSEMRTTHVTVNGVYYDGTQEL